MGLSKSFLFGLVMGFLMLGCVSASLGYKAYGVAPDSYGGMLLGPKVEDDIPFSTCAPDSHSKGKCYVMLTPEFKAMATELVQLRAALKDCQQGK